MSETITASNGVMLPLDSLPVSITYIGSGAAAVPETLTVEYRGVTYVQTLTYDSGNLIAASNWIAQS
jgi:hypothetical protein